MTKKPMVSVCMITYGHEAFITQAITNVLNQEVSFTYELVIANDCSPDNTDAIIKNIIDTHEKGHLIDYYLHKDNIGMMSNFAFALNKCKGKYIAICEGDDYWSSTRKLQIQTDFLESNNDYVLVGHNAKLNINSIEQEKLVRNIPEEYVEFLTSDLITKNPFVTCTTMFKNIGLADVSKVLNNFIVGDIAVFTLLSFKGKTRLFAQPLGFYRKHENSVTSKNRIAYVPYKKELINRINHAIYWNTFSGNKFNDEEKSVTAYRSMVLTKMALRNLDIKTAIKYAKFVKIKDIKKPYTKLAVRLLKLLS